MNMLCSERKYDRRCKGLKVEGHSAGHEKTVRLPMRENWDRFCSDGAAEAFEFFAIHHYTMIKEMDNFIAATHGRKCFLDVGAHLVYFPLLS